MSSSGDDAMMAADKTNYPRTGKRGVPQTFPRKLHTMLQAESEGMIVHWSGSGRAFRIADASRFSAEILPRYFKTSKFSSFQRNLNLYGFAKIRKGPEIDMYFHARFSRGDEEGLCRLRKRTKAPAVAKANRALGCFRPQQAARHSVGFSSFGFQLPTNQIRAISPTLSTESQHDTLNVYGAISPTHSTSEAAHGTSNMCGAIFPTISNSKAPRDTPNMNGRAIFPTVSNGKTLHDTPKMNGAVSVKRNSERLMMLADVMVMMIGRE